MKTISPTGTGTGYPPDGLEDHKPFYHGAMSYAGNAVELEERDSVYVARATGVYRTYPSSGATAVAGRFTADVRIVVSFNTRSDPAESDFSFLNMNTRTSDGAHLKLEPLANPAEDANFRLKSTIVFR